jgi:hypothetical protein
MAHRVYAKLDLCAVEKSLPPPGIESAFFGHVAHSLIATPDELPTQIF